MKYRAMDFQLKEKKYTASRQIIGLNTHQQFEVEHTYYNMNLNKDYYQPTKEMVIDNVIEDLEALVLELKKIRNKTVSHDDEQVR